MTAKIKYPFFDNRSRNFTPAKITRYTVYQCISIFYLCCLLWNVWVLYYYVVFLFSFVTFLSWIISVFYTFSCPVWFEVSGCGTIMWSFDFWFSFHTFLSWPISVSSTSNCVVWFEVYCTIMLRRYWYTDIYKDQNSTQ